jgi:hypothetical protein
MLSTETQARLQQQGLNAFDEVSLREELEKHAPTYTLIRLAAWPARRWKCHYRLMLGDAIHDAQNVAEAYAMALLSLLERPLVEAEPQPSHS